MSAPLQGYQKSFLRGLAHKLKPAVTVGQDGLSDGVLAEIETSLARHELIKVKLNGCEDRAALKAASEQVTAACGCALAGTVGHTLILFRQHPDPEQRRVSLPDRAPPASG